jgi:hypothetical protein
MSLDMMLMDEKVNLMCISLYNSVYNLHIQFILIIWFLKWPEKYNSLYNLEELDWDLHDTYEENMVYIIKNYGSRGYHISSYEHWVKNYVCV